jgi:rhamnulokinase
MGAESGRVIAGRLDPEQRKLTTHTIRQFQTGILPVHGRLRWNVYRFLEEILAGMKECGSLFPEGVESIGFDTWGVDFGLLSPDGTLLELPVSYRDPRTTGLPEEFAALVPKEKLYDLSGVQILELNTLFQLFAMKKTGDHALKAAKNLLFLPDLFNYLLSGNTKSEYTISTTSQLLNCRSKSWDPDLVRALGLPLDLFGELVFPGTRLGELSKTVQDETGIRGCAVTAVGCHDTASAIAAVPAEGEGWAYISSGTWSLVGLESPDPVLTDASFRFNVANEGGVQNTYRVLKNMAGLWLLQRYRASSPETAALDYEALVRRASATPDFRSLVDPDDPRFFNPKNMAEAIAAACRDSGQHVPSTVSEFVTVILSSLAFKYRWILENLGAITGLPIRKVHVIGGGARNPVLNQFAANATGLPVTAGPFEATSVGNMLVQAIGLGVYESLAQIRQVVRNSFEVKQYQPQDTGLWSQAYPLFLKRLNQTGV